MILGLLSLLRGWQFVDRLITKVAGHFTTWPADEFSSFMTTPIGQPALAPAYTAQPPTPRPIRPPEPASIAPGAFEIRFTRLQREGRYEQMWAMLAEDAQRSWGSEDNFIRGMGLQEEGAAQLLEAEIGSVNIVREWTDSTHNRTYRNVARLADRYRPKPRWRAGAALAHLHLDTPPVGV